MTNPLIYQPTPLPEGGVLKFSPSQFSQFIDKPHQWYRTEVLREDGFSHNTSTVIGTIVHYCAEMVSKGEEVDQKAIEEYISSLEKHEDYDPVVVRAHWVAMAERLVNDYVLEHEFLEVETQHVVEIKQKYYAGLDDLEQRLPCPGRLPTAGTGRHGPAQRLRCSGRPSLSDAGTFGGWENDILPHGP